MRSIELTTAIPVEVIGRYFPAIGATLEQPAEPEHFEILRIWVGDLRRHDISQYLNPATLHGIEEECLKQVPQDKHGRKR